jgi:hypothetical protein
MNVLYTDVCNYIRRQKRPEGETGAFRLVIALQTRNPIRLPPSRAHLSLCKFSLTDQFFPKPSPLMNRPTAVQFPRLDTKLTALYAVQIADKDSICS